MSDKSSYLNIPFEFLAKLAGLIDGDGYIAITRTSKGYIEILLSISLDVRDLPMLQEIRDTLGFGRIAGPYYNSDGTITVKLIFSRTQLQELLFPLLAHHNIFFLTNTRRNQFNLAMFVFFCKLTKFDTIPPILPLYTWLPMLPSTALGYLDLPFFLFWIVGLTASEGSFLVKGNNDACFQLKQRIHILLFDAFKLVFGTNRKIGTEADLYQQFSVSSKKDIQTVIDFFSKYNLIGYKLVQYNE